MFNLNSRLKFLFIFLFHLFFGVLLQAQLGVVGSLSRRHVVSTGAEIHGKILVRNYGNSPQVVKLYLTGYETKGENIIAYPEPENALRCNASWIHITPSEQLLAAKSNTTLHYVIKVPEDEELTGTYWSMLMLHPVSPEAYKAPEKTDDKQIKVGVRSVTRIAIFIATHIGNTGIRNMRITKQELQVNKQKQELLLNVDMENIGERALNLDIWAEFFDETGISIGRFPAKRTGILPGNIANVKIDISGIPAGKYQTMLVADNGDEHVFGARYNLQIPEFNEKEDNTKDQTIENK